MSHIAGDKYRARESRPKILVTSCGKGRIGSWKSFHCGRTMQSNGPPSSRFPFPARASCMRASRNSATVRRRKHGALVLSPKQILIAEGELKGIESCIGVLFLRYRGFQGYESAHRSRDRVNVTFSFTHFQCCDLEYCQTSAFKMEMLEFYVFTNYNLINIQLTILDAFTKLKKKYYFCTARIAEETSNGQEIS